MARVLDAEKPDLVVFSGDNIVGSANDVLQAITEFSQPVVDRQIPWAAVFGNHDDEASTTRAQQMAMYQSLPVRCRKSLPRPFFFLFTITNCSTPSRSPAQAM